jgi:hypothetical protein
MVKFNKNKTLQTSTIRNKLNILFTKKNPKFNTQDFLYDSSKNYSPCKNACLFNKVSSSSTWLSSGTQQSTGHTAAH